MSAITSDGLARREAGRFPGGPCFVKFFGAPQPYTRIYLIHNQLTQYADRLSIQCTGHDVRRVSPSERMPATGYHRIKTISDENKKPSCRFYDHNCRARLTIGGPYQRKAEPLTFLLFPSP